MLRIAVLAALFIGAASEMASAEEQEMSSFTPELAAASAGSLGESSADYADTSRDQGPGKSRYAPKEIGQADRKKMTAKQEFYFDKAKNLKRWAMHRSRQAGEKYAQLNHGIEAKAQKFQNRLNLAKDMGRRARVEGKARFNRALGRDVEHPFGNPAKIMQESRDRGFRKAANRIGLHEFLRDMTMTEEQQRKLDKAQQLSYEAGKKAKKALLAHMNLKPVPKEKKNAEKVNMYQNELMNAMSDLQVPVTAKRSCAVHSKETCDEGVGCSWIRHSCQPKMSNKKKEGLSVAKQERAKVQEVRSTQMKPLNNMRGGHGWYGKNGGYIKKPR